MELDLKLKIQILKLSKDGLDLDSKQIKNIASGIGSNQIT